LNILQRGRWYPTAAVLANGSILVIGGETGSNASPQPNLEILPKPAGGDTVINLDWLARTDPNNLYPFVTVLPSKNLFIGEDSLGLVISRELTAVLLQRTIMRQGF